MAKTRHQMIQRQCGAHALAINARPRLRRRLRGEESHRVRIAVASRADADGVQVRLVQAARNAVEMQMRAQQLPQRCIVEQGMRRLHQPTAGEKRQEPMQPRSHHAERVRLEHVMHPKFAPHSLDRINGTAEMRGIRCQRDGAHGARRGAGNDGERTGRTAPQQIRDALEHADLVGRAGTAARQHQAELSGLRNHVSASMRSSSPASVKGYMRPSSMSRVMSIEAV